VEQMGIKELSDQQKLDRMAITLTSLQSYEAEDSNFLSSIITGDETGVLHYGL
jgi:hypothetical protein